jgi:UDP-3-O-[3-hydroxymyristoyl] N-acetylglucosamine deacetylase/3-hydroxyacyl-[acyl-carrier-protein] dehydratase
VFERVDLPGRPRIPASVAFVTDQPRRTSLSRNGAEVHTVEHLMAAVTGFGIDNLIVEIEGGEVPGGDGSARDFVRILEEAGDAEQEAERTVWRVDRPVSISDGDVSLIALPSRNGGELSISYTLDYPNFIPSQHYTLEVTRDQFIREISAARTFCLSSEVEELQSRGLGKGASYENTLVVGREGVIQNELRYPDEFVRHKILDLLGDLSLFNRGIEGHIVAVKAGHRANARFVEKLVTASRDAGEEGGWSGPAGRFQKVFDVKRIREILPHRYPFLLVDRILHLEEGKRVVGLKNVSSNEEFFRGHFPERPVMPGVLQIEALAQTAGFLLMSCSSDKKRRLAFLLTIDKAKLRKAVEPGDQLILEATAIRIRERTGQVRARASVDGQTVAEAEMKFMLVDAD